MKRNWFAVIIFLYGGFAVLGGGLFSANAYIDQASWNEYFRAHAVIRFFIAIVTAVLLFAAYRHYMPDAYNKRKNKIWFRVLLPVLLFICTFLVNTLVILPLNDIERPSDKKVWVAGTIADKYSTSGSRGGRNYFLVIRDSHFRRYKLQVKKYIYQEYNVDSAFDKTMTEGMLGIIYRKND